jgi:hypothetical protein
VAALAVPSSAPRTVVASITAALDPLIAQLQSWPIATFFQITTNSGSANALRKSNQTDNKKAHP